MRAKTLGMALAAIAGGWCSTTMADSRALHGIHWWGYYDYGQVDPQPAMLMNTAAAGGWNVEVVNTHGPAWQNPWFYEPLYRDLYQNRNVTLITRVEYEYGKTVPSPATIATDQWAADVVGLVNTLKDGGRWWQLGNEPNLHGEGQGWENNQITPQAYADIYRQVRSTVRAQAQQGAPGEHQFLLAPVSPGGVIPGVRWMDGNQWLAETIDAFGEQKHEIDGIALHAYGGSVQEFRGSIAHQLAVLESRGLSHLPVFITEWNRYANPTAADAMNQEAQAADFLREAFKAIDQWNNTPGNHNIVSMSWFVHDAGVRNPDGTGPWDGYSLKYWKDAGNPHGHDGNLYTAFEQAVAKGYAAGIHGTHPIPQSIQIIDNFEAASHNNGNGHFHRSLTFASAAQRFGFDTTISSVTRDGGASYSKAWGQKLQVYWNGDDRGWQIRHVSGDSTPATNQRIDIPMEGEEAFVGFFLRTATPGIQVSLVVDGNGMNGGPHTDAGIRLNVIGDNEWHYYEWSLLDSSHWRPFEFIGDSDGVLPGRGGYVTIDSIMFYGPTANATIWFDFVAVNHAGSLERMTYIPEPAALGPVLLVGVGLAARRRR
jgi:hypothetical protein